MFNTRSSMWDHPRVCGEHSRRARTAAAWAGSSPRMRGAPALLKSHGFAGGIIPAYAGSTHAPTPWTHRGRDHPRVCGEHLVRGRLVCVRQGSSPRMRGALAREVAAYDRLGIIPAYAGSTLLARRVEPHRQDHPRVCGEHWISELGISKSTGSSPRMRGARSSGSRVRLPLRIIPAYAGSTCR